MPLTGTAAALATFVGIQQERRLHRAFGLVFQILGKIAKDITNLVITVEALILVLLAVLRSGVQIVTLHGKSPMTKMDYTPIKEEGLWPICPHCDKEIKEVRYFEQTGVLRMKVVRLFVCSHCLKVLGTGMVGG